MNYFIKVIMPVIAMLLLLAACDKAVRANKSVTYIVKGDQHSLFYPLAVRQESEDVRIQLQQSAPVPSIFSIDAAGHAMPFYFSINENTIIVPGKFEHLQLRHEGVETIDILSVKH